MKLAKNFNLIEAQSKDGAEMPEEVLKNVKKHAKHLQKIREALGARLIVISWYRSEDHNKAVKGAENSLHLVGLATDLVSDQKKPIEIFATIQNLISKGEIPEGGLKLYTTFVHYDSRGTRARW